MTSQALAEERTEVPPDGCDDVHDISEADSLLTSPSYTSCATDDSPPAVAYSKQDHGISLLYVVGDDDRDESYVSRQIFNEVFHVLELLDAGELLEQVNRGESRALNLLLATQSNGTLSKASLRKRQPEAAKIPVETTSEIAPVEATIIEASPCPAEMPSLALLLYLLETDSRSGRRLSRAEAELNKRWRFHHRETVSGSRLQVYPNNSIEYWALRDCSTTAPLCSLRQIHTGPQSMRLTRYVSALHWENAIEMYSMLLPQCVAQRPRKDLVLFYAGRHANCDVQLSLRKLPNKIEPLFIPELVLQFRVTSLGSLISLLPNPCTQLSQRRWCTTDHDGNLVVLLLQSDAKEKLPNSKQPSDDSANLCKKCSRSLSPSRRQRAAKTRTNEEQTAFWVHQSNSAIYRSSATTDRRVQRKKRRKRRSSGSGNSSSSLIEVESLDRSSTCDLKSYISESVHAYLTASSRFRKHATTTASSHVGRDKPQNAAFLSAYQRLNGDTDSLVNDRLRVSVYTGSSTHRSSSIPSREDNHADIAQRPSNSSSAINSGGESPPPESEAFATDPGQIPSAYEREFSHANHNNNNKPEQRKSIIKSSGRNRRAKSATRVHWFDSVEKEMRSNDVDLLSNNPSVETRTTKQPQKQQDYTEMYVGFDDEENVIANEIDKHAESPKTQSIAYQQIPDLITQTGSLSLHNNASSSDKTKQPCEQQYGFYL